MVNSSPSMNSAQTRGKDIYLGHWQHLLTSLLFPVSHPVPQNRMPYIMATSHQCQTKGRENNTLAISDGHAGPPLVIDQVLPLNDVRKERVGAILGYSGEEVASPNSLSHSPWHTWAPARLTAALTSWWGSDRSWQDWEGWGGTDSIWRLQGGGERGGL